jgi:ribosomal protein S18 acetylase RimI-like enzyme
VATPASSSPLSIRRATASDAGAILDCLRCAFGTVAWQVAGPAEGHLRGVAVLPAHAGTGVAEQLLTAAERALRERGCVRISLDTTEPLRRAIRFYGRHGFRRSGRVSDFFGMPLVEYVKELA